MTSDIKDDIVETWKATKCPRIKEVLAAGPLDYDVLERVLSDKNVEGRTVQETLLGNYFNPCAVELDVLPVLSNLTPEGLDFFLPHYLFYALDKDRVELSTAIFSLFRFLSHWSDPGEVAESLGREKSAIVVKVIEYVFENAELYERQASVDLAKLKQARQKYAEVAQRKD